MKMIIYFNFFIKTKNSIDQSLKFKEPERFLYGSSVCLANRLLYDEQLCAAAAFFFVDNITDDFETTNQWDQAAAEMVEVFEEVIHAAHHRSRAA